MTSDEDEAEVLCWFFSLFFSVGDLNNVSVVLCYMISLNYLTR